jgi:protein O-mannosyl-transferase
MKKNAAPLIEANSPAGRWKIFLLAACVVVVTFLAFAPALKNSFINWDDNYYVFENKNLAKPLPDAIKFFFGPHYFVGNYIPLTMIVYALEYHAVGLEPQFYHTVNIFIHLANVLLVFGFIYLISGRKSLVAALVSLFFGIHPMHVESVSWIAELKDVLYTFFFIAGLIVYYLYITNIEKIMYTGGRTPVKNNGQFQRSKRRMLLMLALTFIFFVLSALSKPAAVTFPLDLLLLDFYTKRPFNKWMWMEKIPLFIISVIFGVITIKSQQADRLLHDYYPFSQRLLFASHSLLSYIVKLILPLKLSIFHPYPRLIGGRLPYSYYLAPAIVALLFYGVYRTLRHSRLVAFGFLFFFVNIMLVLQLLSIGDAIMAERYTYIPYIGLLFILAMGFNSIYESKKQLPYANKSVVATAVIGLAVISARVTYARCSVWENDDTIATDLLNKFPDDRLALNNKGFILFMQRQYNESIDLFTRAIELKPDYTMAYINLINCYMALKDYSNAERTIDIALKYAPLDHNLLTTKGYILFTQQKYSVAINYLKNAIRLKKDNTNAYIYLAQCYYAFQDYDNELNTLDTALRYDSGNFILLNNKGYALFLMKKYSEALEYFKASLQSNPGYVIAQVNLSDCYRAMNGTLR